MPNIGPEPDTLHTIGVYGGDSTKHPIEPIALVPIERLIGPRIIIAVNIHSGGTLQWPVDVQYAGAVA